MTQRCWLTTILVLALILMARSAHAAVPLLINYQGILSDSTGVAYDTSVAMTFTIYNAASGGIVEWTESHATVPVVEGRFNVLLGSITPIHDSVFASPTRYLGIQIGGDPELVPRTQLVSVPYAHRSATVDGASGGDITSSVRIGSGHEPSGTNAFVAGRDNAATGSHATVSGGRYNKARGSFATVGGGGADVIGDSNLASGGWSTVGGGRRHLASGTYSTIGGGDDHTASGDWSIIAGGQDNATTAKYTTVGGGLFNHASRDYASVLGGETNLASGRYASVPGGLDNTAGGDFSVAVGRNAKVDSLHDGTFLYADSLTLPFNSAAANEFAARATGGVRFVTSVDDFGGPLTGACLAAGSGTWSSCSDESLKTNITPVDTDAILAALNRLSITSWSYVSQDSSVRHIGPMAQEFYRAFGLGKSERHITVIDADGVALAAIQALSRRVEELERLVRARD
ncbi:MAG: tail fiber domain-containing protein [Candidatus Zixiibacteriota bacterium]